MFWTYSTWCSEDSNNMLTSLLSKLQINVANMFYVTTNVTGLHTHAVCKMCKCIFSKAHKCVRVFVCVTGGWSFTVGEPPNPSLSMSSSRAHRNSAVQSCSHSCYSRGWWPPKSPIAEREGSLLRYVGGPSSANLPYRVTVMALQHLHMSLALDVWILLNVPRKPQRGYLHTSEGISLQVGQN